MQQGEIAKLIWSMQADLARALPKALTQTSVLYHVLHSTMYHAHNQEAANKEAACNSPTLHFTL